MRQTNMIPANTHMCSACNTKQSNKLQKESKWKPVKDEFGNTIWEKSDMHAEDLKTKKKDSEVGENFHLFPSHCHSE